MSIEIQPMTERGRTPFAAFVAVVKEIVRTYKHESPTSCWRPGLFYTIDSFAEREPEVFVAEVGSDTLRSLGWPAVRDAIFPETARTEGAKMLAIAQHSPIPVDLVDEDGVVSREVVIIIALDPWHRSAYRACVIRDPTGEEMPRLGSWSEMSCDRDIHDFISPLHRAICPQG